MLSGVFMQSMSRCYKQDHLVVVVRELLQFSHSELFLVEAGSWDRGPFKNPEEREHKPLEMATKQHQ
jgi:hypothetical protein